ncbi:MAG: endo-1,4-beta-xylanase [Mariniphaga sp.]|nr:endo-1,4-beta-xylanase [Mariniphaga sp.]
MKIKLLPIVLLIILTIAVLNNCTSNSSSEKENKSEIIKEAKVNIEKYRKTDFSIQINGLENSELNSLEVEVEQLTHDFLFGCIIFDLVSPNRQLDDEEKFKAQFKNLFNFAVFPFYWSGYEPEQGNTNQMKIAEVANWCLENGITCKGHPLVWTHTAGTPGWLSEYSTEESKKLLQKRVENIVFEFENQIEIWDVINEVIHTVNWDKAMAENNNGTDNRYTGSDLMAEKVAFIDSCFQWAHQANSDAELIINEFNIVANEKSRQEFHNVVKALLDGGTPISGLGIQAHEPNQGRYYYSPEQLWETFNTYKEFNLPMHLTELIPVSNGDSIVGGFKTGIWTEEIQAEFAEMIFTLGFGYPQIESINWWGFTDRNIWQENGGLVDENLEPKLVYIKLDQLINHDWKTIIKDLRPDKSGKVSFRGFKGNYKVLIKQDGKILKNEQLNYSDTESVKNILKVNLSE